ncbi:MAG: sulfatase-like hydrolase/transferase [Daejeonella sp.]
MKRLVCFLIMIPLLGCGQAKKPNIIIILADDLGWGDVGFHGSEIMTPNIDQLAKEGVILNRFYTASICSPTRAGLLTGRYPDRFGLRETVIPPWSDFGVDTNEVFIPQILEKAGYKNRAILGKWHLGHSMLPYHPLKRGFTHFYGHFNGAIDYFTHKREGELDWHNDYESSYDKGYATDLISEEAVKCIQKYSKESPFFLYVAFNAPHSPLQAKKVDLLRYGFDETKPVFADNENADKSHKGNTKRQTYAAMVSNMDDGIGKILQVLKELKIEDNTIVLFQSDNGAGEAASSGELRGHKYQEWEGGVRAPAIIKWPNGFKGSRQIEQVMGYIDVMPTLCEVAGIKDMPKNPFDGSSMLPILKGKKYQTDRNLYLGNGAMVNNNWKLLLMSGANPRTKLKEDMLFDMASDLVEKNNVLADNMKIYTDLKEIIKPFEFIKASKQVPPKEEGQKGFKAPKEWKINGSLK